MLSNSEIGSIGESYAFAFLEAKNYQILARNWRFKRAEIDIIAKSKHVYIFIEVKTRAYTYYGQPEEFITPDQESRIIDASQHFLEDLDPNAEIRFDIISILLDRLNRLKKISHFKDAFFF